jgi:hypothetical protein
LFVNQLYFGLEAQAFRAGAKRVIARSAAQDQGQTRICARHLAVDFRLDAAASWTLLRLSLAGGLLHPDGTDSYRPTDLLHEYAHARVVAPLSRARAKGLIRAACELATRINSDWNRNPLQIETMAVSGSYMSRVDTLPELSLWLVLRPRPTARGRRWKSSLTKGDGTRQILTAVNELSSFIVLRVVTDRQAAQRPFSVAFQVDEDMADDSVSAWERLREWSASITRRLAAR